MHLHMARRPRRSPLQRLFRAVNAGVQNTLEVMRLSQMGPMPGAAYEIVDRDRIHRLRRYARPEGRDAGTGPLLLIPPLMLQAEIYDISPDLSCIGPLLEAGIDVFIVDFGAPEREEGGMERTLDDHVRTVARAVETVARLTGRDVHLAGYSQGGMFCYQAAAFLRSRHLASLITFGSPVDVHKNLPLLHSDLAEGLIRAVRPAIDATLDRLEGLPGALSSTGFRLLTPRKELEQMFDLVRRLYDRKELEKRQARRRFLGGEGFVAWPGPALRALVEEFVVHNRMVRGGFVIDGRPVTLADITVPILCFVGLRDDIARPAAVRGIRRAAPLARVSEIALSAGHFGLVIGGTARKKTWPAVVEWLEHHAGLGPEPALLRPAEAPTPDWEEGSDAWEVPVALDYELLLDTAFSTVSRASKRVVEWFSDASDTVGSLRYQLPRLRRLEQLQPDDCFNVGAELARRAEEAPDATFFLHQGRAFSAAQADRRVSAVVRGLFWCGVVPGDRVAVLMHGRPSLLTMVTALNRMGSVAVVVPSGADAAALRARLGELGVRFVATDPDHLDPARATGAKVLVLGGGAGTRSLGPDVVDMEAIDPSTVTLPAGFAPDVGRARDLALILLGEHEGGLRASLVTNHRWAFSALGAAAACTLSERDTVYACLPLHHPAGLLVSVGSALVAGARLALGSAFSPETFWTEVRRYGATVVFYAGEMARGLLVPPKTSFDRTHPLRLLAGSGMRSDLARDVAERFGVGVLEFYASTTHNVVLANASGEKPGALGRPLPGTADTLLVRWDFAARAIARDARGRAIVAADGEPAAVLVAARDRRDEATERDVLAPGDAWFLLNDLLRRDEDGDHHFVETWRHVAFTPEGPVFPRAVEDALYRLPAVEQAVAQWIDGAIVATVYAHKPLDAAALGGALAELPPPARPRLVRIARRPLPMTPGFRVRPPVLAPADLEPGDDVEVLHRLPGDDGYARALRRG